MSSAIYRQATPEDWAASGPHVWPRRDIDHIVDRYIARRPEIPYRVARRRLTDRRTERGLEPNAFSIGVRILRSYHEKKRRKGDYGQRFAHQINWGNDIDDARAFLHRLRTMLMKSLPDRPQINLAVQLRFYDVDEKTRNLLTWQDRWL